MGLPGRTAPFGNEEVEDEVMDCYLCLCRHQPDVRAAWHWSDERMSAPGLYFG
jgi:hypothetical protein